jgi:hypothetical protein
VKKGDDDIVCLNDKNNEENNEHVPEPNKTQDKNNNVKGDSNTSKQ